LFQTLESSPSPTHAVLSHPASRFSGPSDPSDPSDPSVLMIAIRLPSTDTVPLGLTVKVQQRRASDGGSSPNRIVRAAHVSDHATGMRVGVDEGVWSGSFLERHGGCGYGEWDRTDSSGSVYRWCSEGNGEGWRRYEPRGDLWRRWSGINFVPCPYLIATSTSLCAAERAHPPSP
jgi:hypothetical protein